MSGRGASRRIRPRRGIAPREREPMDNFRKPSEKEEEAIRRMEFEKLRKAAEAHRAKMAAEERKRLRELHFMRCPKCGMEMVELPFRNVQIDRCTACGGTYFDQGEIEKLLQDSRGLLSGLKGLLGVE